MEDVIPAPPPAPEARPRAAPPVSRPDAPADLSDRLRLLSAEARDLRAVLESIGQGEANLARYADYIRATYLRMDELVAGLVGSSDDAIRHIENVWEQMKGSKLLSAPDTPLTPEEQTQLLNLLDGKTRRMIYWTGYKTIPERLQRWLDETQPGYIIPFHAGFEDEMPDAEDRQRILQYLAWAPNVLHGGVVDAASGLVYRYEEGWFRDRLTLFMGKSRRCPTHCTKVSTKLWPHMNRPLVFTQKRPSKNGLKP
jgi:hypothetical protein